MTDATEQAKLRVALAAVETLQKKRTNMAVALAEVTTSLHRHHSRVGTDWRGKCGEPECLKAWRALSDNGEK